MVTNTVLYTEELKKIIRSNTKNNKNIKIKLINYQIFKIYFFSKNKDIHELSKR